jgi:fatty-acyl-CoA synthase
VPDDRHGEVLAAVVELRDATTTDELASHVRAHLADFKCPERWELVAALPRDPTGKVLKRHLRAIAGAPAPS